MKITKEVKIGLMALAAIALLIFGYNFLKGKNLLEDTRTFYVVYDQVEGLSPSSSVNVNGLQIGSVTDIKILKDGRLLVKLIINNDFPFSISSIAKIRGGDLIGGKSIAIEPNFADTKKAVSGDTLQGLIEVGLFELVNDQLSPLQEKIEGAVSSVDTLVKSVNYVMDNDTKGILKKSIVDFNTVIQNLVSTTEKVNYAMSDNMDAINLTIKNASETSEKLNRFTDTLSTLELNKLISNLEQTLAQVNSITTKIDNGDGSLGKLINDEGMYMNLERATKQLEELLQDMKLNPKRYVHFSVFGKKNKDYKEPVDRDQ